MLHVAAGSYAVGCLKKIMEHEFAREKEYLLSTNNMGLTSLDMVLMLYNGIKKRKMSKGLEICQEIIAELLKYHPKAQLLHRDKSGVRFSLDSMLVHEELRELFPIENYPEFYRGISLDEKDEMYQCNILHYLVLQPDSILIIKKIIDADPDLLLIPDGQGNLPINYAVQGGSLPIFEALLSAHRKEQLIDEENIECLIKFAIYNQQAIEILSYLLQQPELASKIDENLHSYKYMAVRCNKVAACQLFLEQDPSKFPSVSKFMYLGNACYEGFLAMARLLVKFGHDVNAVGNKSKKTPLMAAARSGHVEVVEFLLSCEEIKVDAKDEEGRTALFFAVSANCFRAAELLIKNGADKKVEIEVDGKPFRIKDLLPVFSNVHMRRLFLDELQEAYEPVFHKEESTSARAYLMRCGYTKEDIEDFKCRREVIEEVPLLKKKQKIFTWCGKKLSSDSPDVFIVESDAKTKYFLYVPEEIQDEAGINPSFWTKRLSLKPRCIKSLDHSKNEGDLEEEVVLGDVLCTARYTRELKTNKVDRVLLFEETSDDGEAVFLIGSRFVPGGLHNLGDILNLQMSLRASKEPRVFELPCEIDEKLSNVKAFSEL